mgnify:CR=1 FL=1
MPILNLSNLPNDPIERLLWLSGVQTAVTTELDAAFAEAYFDARLQGRFETAMGLGLHGKKRALAFTRHHNNINRRLVRWGDSLDPTSTLYAPPE